MNGYIEEMMNGQKVINVFCHEEAGIDQFTKLNEKLRESTDKANTFANIVMPVNAVVRAIAGTKRIFELLDEELEVDDGYVELVNVKENGDGSLKETDERTNVWAWKHPHKADGTIISRIRYMCMTC